MRDFYEFFAGGGMARAGLGASWRCAFANEIDTKKAASYVANWGEGDLLVEDVAKLTTRDLPGTADLAWASFPCQDLSLAGAGAGLKGDRSGTFWPFWSLMKSLAAEGRGPRLIALENVCGALTSHSGKDFAAIGEALSQAGYRFGAIVVDAVYFLPHSRPRLFVIAARKDIELTSRVCSSFQDPAWHTPALIGAYEKLSEDARASWVWWRMAIPPKRDTVFADIVEEAPTGVKWHTREETQKLLSMMSDINLAKVHRARNAGRRMVGAIYKRTRPDETGQKVQRAEIRFDDIAGCLRTPVGGSSRQTIMVIEGKTVRSRLLSPREAARLMGLSDDYVLPENYNEAYHLAGDGVAVPVVRYLGRALLEPILSMSEKIVRVAA